MATATSTKRKLVLRMSVSLDGFVAGPNGELDWIFRNVGADSTEWIGRSLRDADAHLMGSRTYRDMAAFWPYSDSPLAAAMNDIPKVVFSRGGIESDTAAITMPSGPSGVRATGRPVVTPSAAILKSWAEPLVLNGDLADEIQRLKEQPGHIILAHGGARFARSLVVSGLVDEYRLVIHPVVLGQGEPLFSELRSPATLRLEELTPFASGAFAAVYRPS